MLVSYKTSFLTFESLRPLSAVQPPPTGLYAQAVAFTVLPVSLEVAATVIKKLKSFHEPQFSLACS